MNQSTIKNYFKSASKVIRDTKDQNNMEHNKFKRRSLSLTKLGSPSKVKKEEILPSCDNSSLQIKVSVDIRQEIIDVSDDDDCDIKTPNKSQNVKKIDSSVSSGSTVVYSLTPNTPAPSPGASLKSPSSRKKFFSPTKNRGIQKRVKNVKKNLNDAFSGITQGTPIEDDTFRKACDNMTDKTVFLLKIINKYNKTETITHLLNEDSQKLLSKCFGIVKPGMGLVCRLFWRQHSWYRVNKIMDIAKKEGVNFEDPTMQLMLNSLCESGFLDMSTHDSNNMTFEDYASLLQSNEVKQICKDFKIKMQNKQDAVKALKSFCYSRTSIAMYCTNVKHDNLSRVLKVMSQTAGPCYKLSDKAFTTLDKLHVLMYLGVNSSYLREKKLELMLINNKINIETFPVHERMLDDPGVVFEKNSQFESYYGAYCLYEDYLLKTQTDKNKNCVQNYLNEICEIIKDVYSRYKNVNEEEMTRCKSLPIWLRKFTPAAIYVKILNNGIQQLKKMKITECYNLALDILNTLIEQNTFSQHKKHKWYSEKALILHSYCRGENNSCDEAARVLIEGFKSNMSSEAKDHLRARALLLVKQKNIVLTEPVRTQLTMYANKEGIMEENLGGVHIYKQPMDKSGRGRVQFETRTQESRSFATAEEECINYFIENKDFTHGKHLEGDMVGTMFFLLFWDVIYATLPGVRGLFLSLYQMYPLDMFTENFYTNRVALIEDRLAEIESSSASQIILKMKNVWDTRPSTEMSGISRKLEWESISSVCACLGARSIAFVCRRLATCFGYARSGFPDLTLWNIHTKKVKFVEVKTDTDKPSVKQKQWLSYLQENGMDAEFCYIGANTTRNRSRAKQSDEV